MHYFVYDTPANLYIFYDDNYKNYTGNTFGDYDPKKIKYYGYIQYRTYEGWRANSQQKQMSGFASLKYNPTQKLQIGIG